MQDQERQKNLVQEASINRQPPVEWFSPTQLWRTSRKTRTAETIAAHTDHREIQAGFANIYHSPGNPLGTISRLSPAPFRSTSPPIPAMAGPRPSRWRI